jgi:hypothetical protein
MRLDVHRGLRTTDVALETLRLAFALATLSHRYFLLGHKLDAHRDWIPDDVQNGRGSLHVFAQLFELSARRVGLHGRRVCDALKSWPGGFGQTEKRV